MQARDVALSRFRFGKLYLYTIGSSWRRKEDFAVEEWTEVFF